MTNIEISELKKGDIIAWVENGRDVYGRIKKDGSLVCDIILGEREPRSYNIAPDWIDKKNIFVLSKNTTVYKAVVTLMKTQDFYTARECSLLEYLGRIGQSETMQKEREIFVSAYRSGYDYGLAIQSGKVLKGIEELLAKLEEIYKEDGNEEIMGIAGELSKLRRKCLK